MDKNIKDILSKLFEKYCFVLSSRKNVCPTYFLMKGFYLFEVVNKGLDESMYFNYVRYQAERINADAVILIRENVVVSGNPNDTDMKAISNGSLKIHKHPEKTPYLVLAYSSKNGENEALFGKIENDLFGGRFITKQEWADDVKIHSV